MPQELKIKTLLWIHFLMPFKLWRPKYEFVIFNFFTRFLSIWTSMSLHSDVIPHYILYSLPTRGNNFDNILSQNWNTKLALLARSMRNNEGIKSTSFCFRQDRLPWFLIGFDYSMFSWVKNMKTLFLHRKHQRPMRYILRSVYTGDFCCDLSPFDACD